jgi:hypothetical protein
MCDHCNKGYWNKQKCLHHETMCLRNPERVCGKCKELGVEQKPLSFYLATDIDQWYGDLGGFRKLANGCPLCMLAAKMATDKTLCDYEKWHEFDYKAEVKRCEEEYAAKHPEVYRFSNREE